MMRKSPSSSMQKCYDECYLICSTAIYFEGQNNEPEALRAWRNALDQIYYHNAYKLPSSYAPRTETEKALHDSLRAMEMQCKERVDLLEALRKSRLEAAQESKAGGDGLSKSRESLAPVLQSTSGVQATGQWLGDNTVPQATYSDIPRPQSNTERRPPPPPRPSPRPSIASHTSSGEDVPRKKSLQPSPSPNLAPTHAQRPRNRTPSPEKRSGMLKTLRSNPRDKSSSGKMVTTLRTRPPPAAARAATQVWGSGQQRPPIKSTGSSTSLVPSSSASPTASPDLYTRPPNGSRQLSSDGQSKRPSGASIVRPPSPSEYMHTRNSISSYEDLGNIRNLPPPYPEYPVTNPYNQLGFSQSNESVETAKPMQPPPPPPPHKPKPYLNTTDEPRQQPPTSLFELGPTSISYMKEYPNNPPLPVKLQNPPPVPGMSPERTSDSDGVTRRGQQAGSAVPRKAVGRAVGIVSATAERQKLDQLQSQLQDRVRSDRQPGPKDPLNSNAGPAPRKPNPKRKIESKPVHPRAITPPTTDDSPDSDYPESPNEKYQWEQRVKRVMKKLPKGVDEQAAKQIFNEIVIQGDEVHWDDVAGLENAKSALKETVVYPFLRPDLFMGLREPARGMLLFGPPGTGKTMLARAVATESKSVFFAISASSLTSKFLGESEKLVRALFALAKELAPSIIFVDEIDSLLGSRGGSSEHEATRRIKTEFLIGWSDLQKAAAGREASEGDASRVLVLAATNLPWAIDEAARRRFVRRQYIPLPEDWVREKQLRTLLSAQKHSIRDRDLQVLVQVTDGYSGSDITALAKDAAMGPLRSLGEKLLHMAPDEIRPIGMQDFEASLVNIRPSVSKQGLKEFEDWAKMFGERGG